MANYRKGLHIITLKQILKVIVDLNEQAGGRYNKLLDALHIEIDLLGRGLEATCSACGKENCKTWHHYT